jgi:glycosyltransferase involved in cell wall biosynthesis
MRRNGLPPFEADPMNDSIDADPHDAERAASAPLVSVLMPVFNARRYLARSVQSMLDQTERDFELIVVDDGSTDDTAAIVAAYGDRVRYVRQENGGDASARNRGIALASGALIAFQDYDDLWRPRKIEQQLARFAARPELEACSVFLQNFWVSELQHEAVRFADHALSRPFPGHGAPPAMMVRKTLFDRVGLFNTSLRIGSDTDWFIRATEQSAVMDVVDEVLVDRRLHSRNISRGQRVLLPHIIKASLDRRRAQQSAVTPVQGPFDARSTVDDGAADR